MQASDDRNSFTEYDVSHSEFSWMQDVNLARSEEEQNLEALRTSEDEEIYFRSRRDISAGEELRVRLAPSLEQEHGLLYPRGTEEEFKG